MKIVRFFKGKRHFFAIVEHYCTSYPHFSQPLYKNTAVYAFMQPLTSVENSVNVHFRVFISYNFRLFSLFLPLFCNVIHTSPHTSLFLKLPILRFLSTLFTVFKRFLRFFRRVFHFFIVYVKSYPQFTKIVGGKPVFVHKRGF